MGVSERWRRKIYDYSPRARVGLADTALSAPSDIAVPRLFLRNMSAPPARRTGGAGVVPASIPPSARALHVAHALDLAPNILTVGRMIAAPMVALVFLLLPRPWADWVAMFPFLGASLTDYVDGY